MPHVALSLMTDESDSDEDLTAMLTQLQRRRRSAPAPESGSDAEAPPAPAVRWPRPKRVLRRAKDTAPPPRRSAAIASDSEAEGEPEGPQTSPAPAADEGTDLADSPPGDDQDLAAHIDWNEEAPVDASRMVYFFTIAQVAVEITRQVVATVFESAYALAHPIVEVLQYSIFREFHADGGAHFHVIVKTNRAHRWKPVCEKLHPQFKAHVTASAMGYNVFFRYCSLPSTKKNMNDLDPEPLLSATHPPRYVCLIVPKTNQAMEKNTRTVERSTPAKKAKKKEPSKRVYAGMVARQLGLQGMKPPKAIEVFSQHAQAESDNGRHGLLDFLYGCKSLGAFIQMALRVAAAPQRLLRMGKTRLQILQEFADGGGGRNCAYVYRTSSGRAFPCEGRWQPMAEDLLDLQGVKEEFKTAVLHSLDVGRLKEANIFIVGDRNHGKSFCIQPLQKVYDCLASPPGGSFSLQKLPGKEVVLAEDFRFTGAAIDILPIGEFLRWLEGQTFEVKMPKNGEGAEDYTYEEDAPIFFTGPHRLSVMEGRRINHKDTEMITTRLHYFDFEKAVAKPDFNFSKVQCPFCFARMILRRPYK